MKNNTSKKSANIAKQAMIAAIYTVLSVCLSAISYGPVQIRISEALTLLPIYSFGNVWGVTIGCFITNAVGFFTGANILGALDMVFGTFATFAAAIVSYALRKVRFKGMPVLSVIPPVLFNALIVGWELCILVSGSFNPLVFAAQAASVAAGQLVSCGVIGLIVVKTIDGNNTLKQFIS